MPHFENLEEYEANNPKSGKREIVPIAPHSLQATDYSPVKGNSDPVRKSKKLGEFDKMDIEPVSIQQMEREYRAAGKKLKRSRSGNRKSSLWGIIGEFLKSLFGKQKKTRGQAGRDRRPRKKRHYKQGQPHNKQKAQDTDGPGHGRRKRRKKHSGRSKNAAGQQGQGPSQKSRQNKQSGGQNPSGESNRGNQGKKRNRRNRGRSRRQGQQGKAPNNNS